MNRVLFAAGSTVALVGALLGPGRARPLTWRHTPFHSQLYQVSIGYDTQSPQVVVNAFFPRKLIIHAGDRIRWTDAVPGNPQTVTFGPIENTPALIVNVGGAPEINPLVARQQGGRTVGNTQQNVYSSGALMSGVGGLGTSYTLIFPTSGTYLYRSLFHPSTNAEIDVVPAGRAASPLTPDTSSTFATVLRLTAQAVGDAVQQEKNASLNGALVLTGNGNDTVSLDKFSPSGVSIQAGSTVTWQSLEMSGDIHEVIVNPSGNERAQIQLYTGRTADGGLQINRAYTVATSATDLPPSSRLVSGLIYGSSPNYPSQVPSSFKLTFTQPGSYFYVDPFHGMAGIINVVGTPTVPATPTASS